jgi:Adenylyl/Guanylyl and SMODS C-terminal sensor domain
MRRCIFCDSDKDMAREHAWPDRINRLGLPSDEGNVRFRFAAPTGVMHSVVEYKEPIADQRNKIVCRTCNQGWTSDLESEISPLLGPMIVEGRRTLLDEEKQNLVALWSIKTAMTPEAAEVEQLRGEIREDTGSHQHSESTKYRGSHYVECYVVKDGLVVARDRQPVLVV